jgi:hypothetical protein
MRRKAVVGRLPFLQRFGTEAELFSGENGLAFGRSERENSVAQHRADTGHLLDRHSVESPMERRAL